MQFSVSMTAGSVRQRVMKEKPISSQERDALRQVLDEMEV